MKTLLKILALTTFLITGCKDDTAPHSDCYKLEACLYHVFLSTPVTALCVVGYIKGKETYEEHVFLNREMLESWSQLNPTAKTCD